MLGARLRIGMGASVAPFVRARERFESAASRMSHRVVSCSGRLDLVMGRSGSDCDVWDGLGNAALGIGPKFGAASSRLTRTPMTTSQLGLLAALGLACLASTVLLVRTAPAPKPSILDRVYT